MKKMRAKTASMGYFQKAHPSTTIKRLCGGYEKYGFAVEGIEAITHPPSAPATVKYLLPPRVNHGSRGESQRSCQWHKNQEATGEAQ